MTTILSNRACLILDALRNAQYPMSRGQIFDVVGNMTASLFERAISELGDRIEKVGKGAGTKYQAAPRSEIVLPELETDVAGTDVAGTDAPVERQNAAETRPEPEEIHLNETQRLMVGYLQAVLNRDEPNYTDRDFGEVAVAIIRKKAAVRKDALACGAIFHTYQPNPGEPTLVGLTDKGWALEVPPYASGANTLDTGSTTSETRPKAKKSNPRPCLCGCGGTTKGGLFIMGHDAKLKSQMIKFYKGQGSKWSPTEAVQVFTGEQITYIKENNWVERFCK